MIHVCHLKIVKCPPDSLGERERRYAVMNLGATSLCAKLSLVGEMGHYTTPREQESRSNDEHGKIGTPPLSLRAFQQPLHPQFHCPTLNRMVKF